MKIIRVLAAAAIAGPLLVTPALASGTVTVTDADKGTRVVAHPGDTVVLTLPSTAWTIEAPKGTGLTALGDQTVAVTRPGPGAPGTTSRRFRAAAAGDATLTASRVSCGEALRCTPAQGAFSVRVHVAAAPVLPHTGSPTALLVAAGAALLVVGGGTVLLGRSRNLS